MLNALLQHQKNISKCLTRSALGHPWNYEQFRRTPQFIFTADMSLLTQPVRIAHKSRNAMDNLEDLDDASKLEGRRISFRTFEYCACCTVFYAYLLSYSSHDNELSRNN